MADAVVHLSSVAGSPLLDSAGAKLGRVQDVIARLDQGDRLPLVTGLKARIGGRELFVPADRIAQLEPAAARRRPRSPACTPRYASACARSCSTSSAAPIAPPRSPSADTWTWGGRESMNKCGCIASAIRIA